MFGFGPQYPHPSPPTWEISVMVRTRHTMVARCSGCILSTGSLTCSRCHTVRYCSQQCQKNGWKGHKKTCNKIRKLAEEAVSASEAIAQEFHGTDIFSQTALVKRGQFDYMHINGQMIGDPPAQAKNSKERYILARLRLMEAQAKCGEESGSMVAFRQTLTICFFRHPTTQFFWD